MTNLKEKVLHALQNSNKVNNVLENISQAQENLLKNHSNPVFNQADKNKILKKYIDLQNLGQSLYRFGKLSESNYLADAREEQENIKNTVLEGGVCYYIWHSEDGEHTCDECKSLDGQIFDCIDEVPERPHPNCKCWVETVEKEDTKPQENRIPPQIPTPQPTSAPTPQPTPAPKPTPSPKTQKWIFPVDRRYPITSPYGWRIRPKTNTIKFHDGIDIGTPMNTPVYAVADGTVVQSGKNDGYGEYVEIDHGNGLHSFYGHLIGRYVVYGKKVKQGQIIAKSGNTGYSTGPHLHFGAHKNNKTANPLNY